ncbi:hypothetical protein PUN28_007323 [Cardiocondyla obscurior]|uniref:Kielin/chordin-like protein n=2 Tax=Cardiocondyla obscurior TaxID=286306 RepID=A0AAW2G7U1_9HYME
MMLLRMLLLIGYLLRCHVARSIAAPAKATSQTLLNEIDVTLRDDGDDDVTTEEPLLKKCIVDGNFYSHSQTIPSYDTNSHCLCVVGEVYCWWQNYNSNTASSPDPSSPRSTAVESNYTSSLGMGTDIVDGFKASGNFDSANQQRKEVNVASSSTSSAPTVCVVMGREYRQGEALPHSTGNCVECSCGTEGRIECSPKDCVALRPEILVAPDKPEVPDGDFEVFNLARDWDINENF